MAWPFFIAFSIIGLSKWSALEPPCPHDTNSLGNSLPNRLETGGNAEGVKGTVWAFEAVVIPDVTIIAINKKPKTKIPFFAMPV